MKDLISKKQKNKQISSKNNKASHKYVTLTHALRTKLIFEVINHNKTVMAVNFKILFYDKKKKIKIFLT